MAMKGQSTMPKRILVTGASGFVGSYLLPVLRSRYGDASFTLLGATTQGEILGVDLLDAEGLRTIVREAAPDVVIHLAGQSSVALGIQADDQTWSVNCTGALHLASAIANHTPHATLLFVSSAEVYGGAFLAGPASESSTLLPLNAYARSKALAERIFADRMPHSVKLIVARPFNHTGPGQRDCFVLPSFAAQIADIETGRQAPCMKVGNLDVRRDVLDVRDVADAYLALLEAAPTLPSRFTVNISSGTTRPIRTLLETLRSLSTVPFEIEIDKSRLRPFDMPVTCGQAGLLKAATGWTPRRPIEETLADLLTAARAQAKPDPASQSS
jgi:GDP-4-dehydro-6-deoxy-D-mannose reductase